MKNIFFDLAISSGFTKTEANKLWQNGLISYAHKSRHYHTRNHIEQMFQLSQTYAQKLGDLEVIRWAIWFHDIVYYTIRSDSEERSAEVALNVLKDSSLSSEQCQAVETFILVTKTHQTDAENTDLNYFLDFDLWILGQPEEVYQNYTQQIRKEYALIPELFYKKGRKKVLEHFLSSEEGIYKTQDFRERYEAKARQNLKQELQNLSGK